MVSSFVDVIWSRSQQNCDIAIILPQKIENASSPLVFDCASFNEILIIFCIKSEVLTLLEGGILAQNRTQLIVNFNHILAGLLACPCPGGLQSLTRSYQVY